jgi:monoamine oxidase
VQCARAIEAPWKVVSATSKIWLYFGVGIASGRRQFLCASAAALATGCLPKPLSSLTDARDRRSVIVIGGGLAGLAIALELVERGYAVKLLEAKSRVGGRILTIRAPWRDGLFVEAGATHVVADPELLALFNKVNVEVERRSRTPALSEVRYYSGKRSVWNERQMPPRAQAWSAEEETLGREGCLDKYFAAAKTLDPEVPLTAASAPLDQLSGSEYLRQRGASPGFIASIDDMIAVGDDATAGMSALYLVQIWAHILRETSLGRGAAKVRGGTDRLTNAIASRLTSQIVREAVVDRIEQRWGAVRVSFTRRGERTSLDVDRVVVAIPSPIVRELSIVPGLSQEKAAALREIRLESVTRAWLATDERFWIARGESGSVESDLPYGGLRDESDGLPGTSGILGVYATRAAARELARLSDDEREARILDHAKALQPGIEHHVVGMESKCWDTDPFQRGAYAWWQPGQITKFGDALARPEGRLHFAGDHTSQRPGFMHGALASARRVVLEIEAADR